MDAIIVQDISDGDSIHGGAGIFFEIRAEGGAKFRYMLARERFGHFFATLASLVKRANGVFIERNPKQAAGAKLELAEPFTVTDVSGGRDKESGGLMVRLATAQGPEVDYFLTPALTSKLVQLAQQGMGKARPGQPRPH